MYEIVKKYKITLQELVDGEIGQIYHRVLCDIGSNRGEGAKYTRMHKAIFPSYLKSFNYKIHFDLLPVQNKFHKFCLDSNEKITCPFCSINLESIFHLFAKCSKLMQLWEMLDESISVCFDGQCKYSFKNERFKMCRFDLVNNKDQGAYENVILYVNTTVRYKRKLINKIVASLGARKTFESVEDRLTTCKKVDFFK